MIDVKVHRRSFEPEVKGDLGFLVSRRDVGDQRASPIEHFKNKDSKPCLPTLFEARHGIAHRETSSGYRMSRLNILKTRTLNCGL